MQSLKASQDWAPPPSLPPHKSTMAPGEFLPAIASALWRGTEFGTAPSDVVPTGWDVLNTELPGGGWPCGSLAEILSPQPSVLEWRLVGPAVRSVVANGGQVVVVGPPKHPHLPGLAHEGLDERHLVWIQAEAPAERLWVTEQLIKSNAAGAVISWLPLARQEQIRRLQIGAQACDGLVLLFRPQSAQDEASAAPLRLHATYGLDWELRVHVFKRRGPAHDGVVVLPSVPGGLSSVLTPRLQHPSRHISRESANVVGSHAPQPSVRRLAAH
jgi:protein ImuA